MDFDRQMAAIMDEWRGRRSCSLLFTRRSRRASGLEAPSPARVRCNDRSSRIEMEREEGRNLQKTVVGGEDDGVKIELNRLCHMQSKLTGKGERQEGKHGG